MIKILQKAISLHRNKWRIFFDGKYLETAGFVGGSKITVDSDASQKRIKVKLCANGNLSVTNSKRNGQPRPVIDLKHSDLEVIGDQAKVFVKEGEILIVQLHTEKEVEEREDRFTSKFTDGTKLNHATFNFSDSTIETSEALSNVDLTELFSMANSALKLEAVSLQGNMKANCDFYLATALIKSTQPVAIELDVYGPDGLFSALHHTLSNMNYLKVSDSIYASKTLNDVDLDSLFNSFDSTGAVTHLQKLKKSYKTKAISERLVRAKDKVKNSIPFAVTGVFHGVGVLCASISDGLKRAGLEHYQKVVVEIEEKYFNASLSNNPIWEDKTSLQQYAICMPIENVDLSNGAVKGEINIAALPCEGSSVSGRSKNGNENAESHSKTGGCFIDWLHWQNVTNPIVTMFENVVPFKNTLSYAVIKDTLGELFGYAFSDMTLKGGDFGALENRARLCAIAVTENVNCDFQDLKPSDFSPTYKHQTVSDVLEPISQDDESYRPFTYLVEKQERDIKAGKGFRLQWLDSSAESVGCIGKSYHKCRSTEPFLKHLTKNLARLFTPVEHARLKQIPERFVNGLTKTLAHEVLGQSVIFTCFSWVGEWIGQFLKSAFVIAPNSRQLNAA